MKKLFSALFILLAVFQLAAAPDSWTVKKFSPQLINSKGRKIDTATALQGKMVAVYFSASWCGPCRNFTPQLVKFYKSVKSKSNLEIVFISSDKTDKDMMKYMKNDKMPWLATAFQHPAAMNLKKELGVHGIPKLVVFDKNGKLISPNARWDVVILGTKAVKAWESPSYEPLTYDDYMKKGSSAKKNSRKNKKKNKRNK